MAAASSLAARLGLPPGYRFVPEDKELVAYYLVPRLLGQPLPPNDIVDDDPLSTPPPLLLKKNNKKRKQDAFFFAEGQPMNRKGGRQKRTCAGGGTWQGQTTLVADEKLLVPGSGIEVEWRKKSFNFHEDGDGKKASTGWVMHEYAVTAPPMLAASLQRVYRIRRSRHGKNAKKRKRGEQYSDSDSDSDDEDEDVPAPAATRRREMVEDNGALFASECPLAAEPELLCSSQWPEMGDLVSGNLRDGTDAIAGVVESMRTPEMMEDNAALFVGEGPLAAEPEVPSSSASRMLGDLVNNSPPDETNAGADIVESTGTTPLDNELAATNNYFPVVEMAVDIDEIMSLLDDGSLSRLPTNDGLLSWS